MTSEMVQALASSEATHSRDPLDEQIGQILASVFKVSAERITPETSIQTLEAWDSLNHLNLVLAIEGHFKTRFRPDEVRELSSVRAISDALKRKKAVLPETAPALATKTDFDRRKVKVPNTTDILPALLASGDLIQYALGVYSLHGKAHRMYEALDRRVLELAREQGAREGTYPVTMPFELLKKSDYFANHPGQAFSISAFHEPSTGAASPRFEHPKSVCRSAGCLHTYPSLAGKRFKKGETLTLTLSGRIFRNEDPEKVRGLERLSEYGMREIIYLGSEEFVRDRLEDCQNWFVDVLTRFDLNGSIRQADDLFFSDQTPSDRAQALQFFQRAQQTKREVHLLIPFNQQTIAVGSLNFHGTHFSKAYDLKFEDGSQLVTACMGLGLERALYALLSQMGLNESRWPAGLAEFAGLL